MRALDVDPVHDTRETFRALLDAASRPGTVERTPVAPAVNAVVATLVDHEVTVHGGSETLRAALDRERRLSRAPFEEADLIVAAGDTDGRVTDAERGTLKEPSEGATVIYEVDALAADATRVNGLALSVTGPGVPGTRTFGVGGLPATEVGAIAEAQSTYPRGVDVFLVDEERVAALPRSVEVEVEIDDGVGDRTAEVA
ncbi:phosphonate C-P lyase system protein PhnH [Halomarina pelagica]|uniref:phosphonate C-P lyase system protein PhnH n=1 Tax=Halomarina pelagica TaxID=2961599 RepID=UPI0020C3C858|nr:phosphonate C-P lyase system protein PhnH [Halomarina sp. BND7]